MPNVVVGDMSISAYSGSYDYKYPLNLNLKPGSRLHTDLLTKVLNRTRASQNEMQKRYPIIDQIEQKLSTYVMLSANDRKLVEENPGRPTAVAIPILYANLDTILTYWLNVFADGPLFKYRGMGPEDRANAMLMELLIDAQSQRMKSLLNLYVQWRDALAFGLGIVTCRWHTEYGNKVNTVPTGFISDLFGRFMQTGTKTITRRELLWEANKLENVHPKRYFPDPSVPCHAVQEMEFVSLLLGSNYVRIMENERNMPDVWFNGKYLKDMRPGWSQFNTDAAKTEGISARPTVAYDTRPIDLLYCYATIIPRDWKLGRGEYPEKWLFVVAADKVIVRAQPMNLNHNKYPVSVVAPSFTGYDVAPISVLETSYEAQVAADFYYKTRLHNLLTMVNNRGIIDPFIARYDDAINSEPGSWIRIREHVWGRGVQNAMEMFPAQDYTQGYLQEINYLRDMSQIVTGAVDSLQGVVRPSGERRSATEMRDTRMSAISRVQKSARIASIQSMVDLGYMHAYHLQQFMKRKAIVQLAGDNLTELMQVYGQPYVSVTPDMLAVDFDVIASDGATPGGEFLPDMINLFRESQNNPVSSQSFDATKQVLDLYKRAGVKGATNFLRVNVMQPQQMQQFIDAGATPIASSGISSSGIGPDVPTEAFNGD